jgi:hypothetical protein
MLTTAGVTLGQARSTARLAKTIRSTKIRFSVNFRDAEAARKGGERYLAARR